MKKNGSRKEKKSFHSFDELAKDAVKESEHDKAAADLAACRRTMPGKPNQRCVGCGLLLVNGLCPDLTSDWPHGPKSLRDLLASRGQDADAFVESEVIVSRAKPTGHWTNSVPSRFANVEFDDEAA